MDRSKLPLSLLVALGLAPEGCTTKDPKTHPCLSAPMDSGKPPDDPPVGPCLKVAPTDDPKDAPVGPCLKVQPPPEDDVGPCLEVMPPPTKEDPPVGPCLRVRQPEPPMEPCLSIAPPKTKPPKGAAAGGMASHSRDEVIDRVRDALPPDVAARLPKRDA